MSLSRRTALKLFTLSPLVALSGCTITQVRRSIAAGQRISQGDFEGAIASQIPSTGIPDIDRHVREKFVSLARELLESWGDGRIAGTYEYIKYSDQYQTRAIINFDSGQIRIETLEKQHTRAVLKQAIINTLLTPADPASVDLLSDKAVRIGGEPFLYGLVLDHQGQAIRYEWRAGQFAEYLLNNAFGQDSVRGKTRYFVGLHMSKQHQKSSHNKYAGFVQQNAKRFKVKSSLIYAVMEAESSFNPYAISSVPAYGLMQIVPTTAGRDAHQLIYGKAGTPTKNYLFVPENNIRMGAAYLSILNDRYLAQVKHPQAREYCVIAGYNTGSGNVLKAFHSNRNQAFAHINRLSPSQVYNHLVKKLPYEETRRYLPKVVQNQRKY